MKLKTLSTLTAIGLAASAYGQGILLNNAANSGGQSATSGGQIFIDNGTTITLFDGFNFNLGVTVMAGADAGSLALLGAGTYTASTDPKGFTGLDSGRFQLGNTAFTVPGVVAGGPATIQLQMWYDGAGGLFANYNAAVAGLGYTATVTFQNPTSNPGGIPPTPDQNLTGMPSVILTGIPEPSTIALAGLGLVSLLALRRRK